MRQLNLAHWTRMKRLRHRGPDGSDVYQKNNIAMGHWHFWTTPEEMGEQQPLKFLDCLSNCF